MKKYVYLAGPMANLNKEQMCGWRKFASDYLLRQTDNLAILDPTRRVTFHDQLTSKFGCCEVDRKNVSRRIFKQDLDDIDRSDVLLVNANFSRESPGLGTTAECMYAYTKNKTIIVFSEKDTHPFIESVATEIHKEFETSLYATRSYVW